MPNGIRAYLADHRLLQYKPRYELFFADMDESDASMWLHPIHPPVPPGFSQEMEHFPDLAGVR